MNERRELSITVLIMLIFAMVGYGALHIGEITPHATTVLRYSATITGAGLLYENYTYHVDAGEKHRILSRAWSIPLWEENATFEGLILKNVAIENGTEKYIPYLKNSQGTVFLLNGIEDEKAREYIAEHTKNNNAGVYFPAGIPAGTYTIHLTYQLHTTLKYNGKNYLLSLPLANEHPKYERVEIRVPQNFYVFASPYLEEAEEKHWHVLSGKSDESIPLRMTMVFSAPNNFSHYAIAHVSENLIEKAKSDAAVESIRYWAAYGFFMSLFIMLWILPPGYLVAYMAVGREKKYPDSGEILTPPTLREPMLVNFVFLNEAGRVDYLSVAMATILQLVKDGYIKLSDDGKKLIVLKSPGEDMGEYAKKVLEFIAKFSGDSSVFDLEKIKEWVKYERNVAPTAFMNTDYYKECQNLIIHRKEGDEIAREYILSPVKGIEKYMMFVFLYSFGGLGLIFLLSREYGMYVLTGFIMGMLFTFSSAFVAAYPDVLGRWKNGYYLEKQKWDAFRSFLKDGKKVKEKYSAMAGYAEQWLIYGYALNEGNTVKKTLEEIDPELPLLRVADVLLNYIGAIFAPLTQTYMP